MDIRDEIKELERRFAEAPDSRLFLPLADALFRAGEFGRARDLCEQGLDSYPDFVAARVLLGKCYIKLGESEKAKEIAEETSRLDSENEQLAEIVEESSGGTPAEKSGGDEPAATAESELADIFITQTLADIYRIQGYDARALEIYHRLYEKNPGDEKLEELIKYLERNGIPEEQLNKREQAIIEPEAEEEDDVSVIDDLIDGVIADTDQSIGEMDGMAEKVFSNDVLQDKVNFIFEVILGEGIKSVGTADSKANAEEAGAGETVDNREYLQMVERWIGELAG